MSQLEVEPGELRTLSWMLEALVEGMKAQELKIQGDVEYISETWSDQRYQEFVERLEGMRLYLQRFYSKCDLYSEFLQRKAQAIENYLDG